MPNRREIYSCRQVGFAKDGTTAFIEAHGVQTVGITTNFNLAQVFEQGQLAIYANIEQVPDVEITMEKVLDGYPLLFHLATNGAVSPTLIGRSNIKTIVGMSIFSDISDSASGTPIAEVSMSGAVPSSLTYTIPVDGNITEAITLVGNDKVWRDTETTPGIALFTGRFNNQDAPLANIMTRKDVVMAPVSGGPTGTDLNGATNGWVSVWPTDIPGINADGTNPANPDGTWTVPIQNVTITADMGRTSIFELGRMFPYWRFVNFPLEVRTEIEVLSRKWENISTTEQSYTRPSQTIKVRLSDGTWLQTGIRNKLSNVAITGGDAGGGGSNVTHRYTYITYNELVVSHPNDPSGL